MIFTLVLIALFLHMCLFWVWYQCTNNPSVVDVGWASGLTLAGLLYLLSGALSWRSVVLGAALLLWGVRLGGYLWWTRIRHKKVDKRYLALSDNWKISKPLGFFLNFQLQGVLIFVISLPWYFTASASVFSMLDAMGIALFLTALLLETTADRQLQDFKKQFPGEVCNQKLWRYSRHPNYFSDWLVWCAFTLFALSAPQGWIAIVSPIMLYLIMTRITAPMTEAGSLASRGERYRQYQQTTSMFFPRRPR